MARFRGACHSRGHRKLSSGTNVKKQFSGVGTILATLLGGLVAAPGAFGEKPFDFALTPGKLPKDIRPSAYRIDLKTDLDKLTFTGSEEVDITVTDPTTAVTLNSNGLAYQHIALVGEDGATATVALDAKAETATLRFPHTLAAGKHTIRIDYSGPIRAQPAGIYYADYDSPASHKRMLVTQFEATDARRMFPGWDEPVFKATYTLSVVVPASYRAVSNTPVTREEPAGNGLKKVSFATTPKMSSYLLALVAGETDRITGSAAGTEIGVVAAAGKGEQGRYGLEAAEKILPYYNDYFGVKYPLPKLDLIAIPGNFAAGAMENWGAITYIDNDLLFDPATSSEGTRQAVFSVIAHEMAHQWSGDLVTMAWWDNIWLNEGFASWMDSKASDHFNPDWKVWLRSHAETDQAMEDDARRTTHPIQQPIRDESEADSAFDDITYLKGQAFIRMIETYLGEETFRDGMRRYMAAHAYSNSTTADLWAALEQASGKPVMKIAAGFTEQPGIPLVKVEVACSAGETVATLTQDRFTIHDPTAKKLSWHVPVTLGRPGEASQSLLLDDKKETVKLAGCGKPVKANIGDVGYYRVQYDDANFKALTEAFRQLPPADRVNFLGDAWAMVEAGRIEPDRFLALTRRLSGETELAVWTEALKDLREIDALERGSPDRPAFRDYARTLLAPVLVQVGWDSKPSDTPDVVLLRSSLIRTLGRFGDPAVIAEAKKRFQAFLANPASLPPSQQDAVLAVVGYTADQQTWDQLHKLGLAATSTETRLRYYGALAGAGDPALIKQTVAIAGTDEITAGRVNRFLAGAAASSDDPDLVWKLLQPEREAVIGKLTGQQASGFLPSVAGSSFNPAVAEELKSLPESNSSAGARHEADQAAEEITFRADLRTRLLPAVSNWLKTGITN
jgi:aminopeptidase N